MKKFECRSLNDTKKAAEYFSSFAAVGKCFCLYGDLGAGKTTFSKYFIQALNPKVAEVISPTFTVVQTYESEVAEIWHVDGYRLESSAEFFNLGLDEAISCCVTLIEWPEIISDFLPADVIKIRFTKFGDVRIIEQIDS